MKNVIELNIWYDTETKHLFINDRLAGICSPKEASKEIEKYFLKQNIKEIYQEIIDSVLER